MCGQLQRQARLATPASARERQQASGCHESQELCDFAIAPDEVRELDGKVVTANVRAAVCAGGRHQPSSRLSVDAASRKA